MQEPIQSKEFIKDFQRYHGREPQLNTTAHWCYDWDLMPIDQDCEEWNSVHCLDGSVIVSCIEEA